MAIIVAFPLFLACSANPHAESQADALRELRAENERLETKITQLQEGDLKAAKEGKALCAKKAEGPGAAHGQKEATGRSASDGIPGDLLVVRLSPDDPQGILGAERTKPEVSLLETTTEIDTFENSSETRTVIQVQGKEEGKLVERKLGPDDGVGAPRKKAL